MSENTETAILAGGCFWGVQELLRHREGVVSSRVGYTGGENDHPTYRNHPGHAEAVEIVFDPERISYRDILEFFFQIHDPTTKDRQGYDIGADYRSEIFIRVMSSAGSPRRRSPTLTPQGCGPARSSLRSARLAPSGRPRPSTRTTCSATRADTPATSPRPEWKLPHRETAG